MGQAHRRGQRGRIALHLAIGLLVVAQLISGAAGSRPHRTAAAVQQDAAVLLSAADPGNSQVRYRVVAGAAGEVVEVSHDGGGSWTLLLSPVQRVAGQAALAVAPATLSPACPPVGYTHVRALLPSNAAATSLFIATAGTPGNYLDRGCDSSVGGLFAVSTSGQARALGTDGLPFAQDPVGRTIRAYDVDAVSVDPFQPGILYVHAGQGTGPASPPSGLYTSTDGGTSWTPINGGLLPSATILNSAGVAVPVYGPGALAVDPRRPGRLTFRNDTGSYSSVDGGRHWRMAGGFRAVPPTPTIAVSPPPTPTPGVPPAASVHARIAAAPLPQGWSWTQLPARGTAPPVRQDAALAWDAADRQLLVFGGANTSGSQAMGDLWAYRAVANTWSLEAPGPLGRFGAAAAWDPVDDLLLVFGGQRGAGGAAAFRNDLWAYRPATNRWTILAASGPSPRSHALLAWDSAAGRLLLFGGETSESPWSTTNDLWSFTVAPGGTAGSWTQIDPGNPGCTITCPQPRSAMLGAWDAAGGALRVFGGRDSANSILTDTWTWTPIGAAGGVWSQENRVAQPAGRAEGAVAYDSTHAAIVLGPGLGLANGNANDIWADAPAAGTWQPLPVAASPQPPPRRLTGWVWDDTGNRFLLFGGRVVGSGAANDLWQLAPTSIPVPAPTALPTAPVTVGLGEGWVIDNAGNPLLSDAHIAAMAQTGTRYARIDFRLANAADWTDPTLLANYDSAVNRFLAAGITVLGLVTNEATHGTQADWTANNRENTGGTGDNPYIAITYSQNALAPLVRHFHDRIKVWELWNEPNSYQSCNGTVCTGGPFMYPSNFAALLADSYAAIKDPAPRGLGLADLTLIAGGLLSHSIGGALTTTNAGADYLTRTFQMGAGTGIWTAFAAAHQGAYPLDGIGQHIYLDQTLLATRADIATYYGWLRNAAAAFATPPPTYMTEGAWSTSVLPPTTQAQNLGILFGATRGMGFVPYALWFQMQDVPAANLYYGLATAAGDRKLSWDQYQTEASTSGPPTSTATASVTATATATATVTATASATASLTPTPSTSTSTSTPTGTGTATPTATGIQTATPSASPSGTPGSTSTATPTVNFPTDTPTASATTPISGMLVGSVAAASRVVNLSAEGSVDWAQWGRSSVGDFNHKRTGGGQIGPDTLVGAGQVGRSRTTTTIIWNDGTPTGSAVTNIGVLTRGGGNGFQIAVPATTTTHTLRLYLSVASGGVTVTAALGDASAPTYSGSIVSTGSTPATSVVTLTFRAAANAQTLTITSTIASRGGLVLLAASLS